MKKLLPFLFSLITLIAFTGCEKEEEAQKETKLQTTAALLKGTWRWTYSRYVGYDKDGKTTYDYNNPNINERFSFDGSMFQNLTDGPNSRKLPYNLTERDGKIFLEINDGINRGTHFTEITYISAEKMSKHNEYINSDGSRSIEKQELTKEL